MQMSMATIVTSGMKNPLKKLEFSQVLPRNIVRQRVSANLSRLEIRTWQTRLRSRHICSAFSHLVVEITGNHYNGRFTLTSLITGDQHRRYKEG